MHGVSALPRAITEHPTRDEAMLVLAARQDPAAFEALYHRYLDRVYAYLRTRTANEDDAADLTQHVFLQAFDALPRYRGQDNAFAAWLFRIARNATTDYHRRRRSTMAWDLLPEALHPVEEHGVETGILRQEALVRLRAIFVTLDTDTRELLVLRFVAGLTVTEIAAVIGKSEAATQKKLFRTIQALKERYHADTR